MKNRNVESGRTMSGHVARVFQWPLVTCLALAPLTALAQVSLSDTDSEEELVMEEVIVSGQRRAILSAQDIKMDADQIVDSIVATDIGKLPDRSVTEALQRVPGVTITHFKELGDPEHFSAEGSGVMVRGLTMVRSEINGREAFTADGGRALSFQDVPPELMQRIDVYKNQTANMIEGGIGGTVDLITKKPFDYDGMRVSLIGEASYGDMIEEWSPSASALFSNRWETSHGEFGVLFDVAYSEAKSRTDGAYTRAFFPRDDIVPDTRVYVPRGADWRTYDFERERQGAYGVVQWRTDSVEMYFQVFDSQYEERWNEASIFVDNWPPDIIPAEGSTWLYDDGNRFLSGRLDSVTGNIPMGIATRYQDRDSQTTDYSYNVNWQASERWNLEFDLQHVKADTNSLDSTVASGVEVPFLDIDLTRSRPIMITDNAHMSDPANYYMAFTMDARQDNEADQTSVRADAEYQMENSVVQSLQFGVRFTDRDSDNRDTGYDWQPIYQQWMRWWALDGMAPMPAADPSYLTLVDLKDFYRNQGPRPGVFMAPLMELAESFPDGFALLHHEAAISGNYLCCYGERSFREITDPAYTNTQNEQTMAAYMMAFFAWDDLAIPVSGNIGVRWVETDLDTEGYIIYPTTITDTDGNMGFYQPPEETVFSNSYDNWLPSLNLRFGLRDDLLLRFAASQAISRPNFAEMQAYRQLAASLPPGINLEDGPALEDFLLTADLWDNPNLEPVEATQVDLSLEWYFDEAGGMTHINLFWKDIDNLISRSFSQEMYGGWLYDVTQPINNGTADLKGIEAGLKYFFDDLPYPWNGFGIDATYTYIDSEQKLDDIAAPVDTDGSTWGNLPMTGISDDAFNFTLMYELPRFWARLAYNWRSKYLMGVGQNGFNGDVNGRWALPVYNDDYGQLDASMGFRITEDLYIDVMAINLTNSETVIIAEQNAAGSHISSYVTDTTYTVRLSWNYGN